MRAYHTIRKLNPNVNLNYEILSCLKFPSLWYQMGDFVIHYTISIIPGAQSQLNKFLIMQLCCKFVCSTWSLSSIFTVLSFNCNFLVFARTNIKRLITHVVNCFTVAPVICAMLFYSAINVRQSCSTYDMYHTHICIYHQSCTIIMLFFLFCSSREDFLIQPLPYSGVAFHE